MAENKNSPAKIAANNRYGAKVYDRMSLAVPKGYRNEIKAHAQSMGQTVNSFINRAIRETVERDKAAQKNE